MLDLELLKTLVCVVDERSFSRAADRVHRTQSTVSQQILKLEDRMGQALLLRDRTGKRVVPTEGGERLAHYARKLLAMAQEAEDALARPASLPPVRIGVPEDFDAVRMSTILSGYMASHADVRLETVSGMSIDLRRRLDAGEIDIALVKREPGAGECIAAWPERLVWVTGAQGLRREESSVPLALFPDGCIYRQRAIRSLEIAGRPWRVAFGSQSLTGIQAAVACGLGVTVLPTSAVMEGHALLGTRDGFPELPPTELALVTSTQPLSAVQREIAQYLATEVEVHASSTASRKQRATRARSGPSQRATSSARA
ncbi:LysR family transcriptional regulator [Variovorax sp. dw_308]|uniref:LysR family transcriptional regulator n=1 Tax=Variovorax sp. dw_308 TaxID=2721546 RepID=UPI001C47EB2E|nr:LysR family transcriptional regulator [Variovorax sp. dw_308]